jgi:hypothetical protein
MPYSRSPQRHRSESRQDHTSGTDSTSEVGSSENDLNDEEAARPLKPDSDFVLSPFEFDDIDLEQYGRSFRWSNFLARPLYLIAYNWKRKGNKIRSWQYDGPLLDPSQRLSSTGSSSVRRLVCILLIFFAML